MNRTRNPRNKRQWYTYEQYWSDRTGEMLERSAGRRDLDELESYSLSRTNPTTRKQNRELYKEGLLGIGERTHGEYVDTVLWGKQGGRPKQWANDAERKRAKRAQQKLSQGQPLTYQEKELLGLMKKRPGAYRTNLGRAMTSAERKAKWKAARKAQGL
ncbi:MAG: hypothetical protein MRECE_35c027 [Mycoplasmataceae bacterium CE_OT135]|nr:MAG: hypothetical protein MRECE_39c013 [Mycoplasmataceae bacterium CE_OT135]KLL02968.1 MAG: hypothetical protein MRECE_35c027 [Mycoplasmataceae bacterium CE_OT135]